jgi:nitrate/TMAO reductase-like tetraheme cytochrome c subunit
MKPTDTQSTDHFFTAFRNWISLTGLVILSGGLFSFLLLFGIDSTAHFSNPYVGILTYFIAPAFMIAGVGLFFLGGFLRRRKLIRAQGIIPLKIDLAHPRDRRILAIFIPCSVLFLLVSAFGVYHSYHYTESVQFCGQACHTVMKPEMTTHQHSSHARIACSECHIGPGATWYVRSKLSGAYQVYATMADKYPRPIPTPVKNLRPAQDTCEQCHWPKKFIGNLDRTFNYFMGDETNTPYSIRLSLKVGGADAARGPVGGIHWHVNPGRTIEYYAEDEARQKIPWVRVTDAREGVTEYRSSKFTNSVPPGAVRTMDCMDCHNRPAHKYQSPEDAVNLALSLGSIDRSLPYIKTNALFILTQNYKNEADALSQIDSFLKSHYPGKALDSTINTVQSIYTNNFFPEMKASWRNYPDNVGHKDWPGCFRCHDGKHKTADKKLAIKASDCNTCHTILAQGSGAELEKFTPGGQEFKHPGGEYDPSCTDCHTGGP